MEKMEQKFIKILIIGLGIGKLYQEQCEKLGYNVTTIDGDSSKNAHYTQIESVYGQTFDLGIICTPNYTHYEYALKLSYICKNVLVEKPGFKDLKELEHLYELGPKIYVVKNNLYRNIKDYKLDKFSKVKLNWITKNRIPHPGSWFTNKSLSYGGVKKDIYPHMIALMLKISNYKLLTPIGSESKQNYTLDTIKSTDYGTIVPNGIYDVEDYFKAKFYDKENYIYYEIEINWASGDKEDISINYSDTDNNFSREELGLCPNDAYGKMVKEIIDNTDNYLFYEFNKILDRYIQKIIT